MSAVTFLKKLKPYEIGFTMVYNCIKELATTLESQEEEIEELKNTVRRLEGICNRP